MSGKFTAERTQRQLLDLANLPGNDVCADCKARAPRWASYNIGIFICMNCASIHRKIGTHVTKVKSLTLDSWSREQVEHMKQVGNVKANSIYNPDEIRHPTPANLEESERDSELEKFIRNKYEFGLYRAKTSAGTLRADTRVEAPPPAGSMFPTTFKSSVPAGGLPSRGPSVLSASKSVDRSEIVASLLGPSRSASSRLSRSPTTHKETAPPAFPPRPAAASAPPVPAPPAATSTQSMLPSISTPQASLSVSPAAPGVPARSMTIGALPTQATSPPKTIDATLPLQVLAQPATQPMAVPGTTESPYLNANPYASLSTSPLNPFPAVANQVTGISPGGINRSMSLNSGLGINFGGGLSPYQPSPMNVSASPVPTYSNNPSPNPFAPQALPPTSISPGTVGSMAFSPGFVGAPSISPQPQTPYGVPPSTSPFVPQQPLMSTTPVFQPQAQMQMQGSYTGSPYAQTTTPGTQFAGPLYTGSPSPFASQSYAQPQVVQQPMQQGFGAANPFTSWIQQPPSGQGGWGGM